MIEFKNIVKTYHVGDIEVKAVRGISLTVSPGEFVAIMGSSGSGKSTLMHLMGLLDRPDDGEYILAGQPVHKLTDDQMALVRNRLVGFVFQQFYLLPRMTALENAKLPLVYAGRRNEDAGVLQRLTDVGLANRVMHKPNELSGGQQQRVAIARALVNDPRIIFADEPTGNLDSKSKDEIMSILKELNRQGKTVIMVTHEPDIALYASRVIQMRDGVIISDKRNHPSSEKQDVGESQSVIDIHDLSSRAYEKMKIFDSFKQAIFAMMSHKMRSFLSILGILIGVGAVIAMLALGHGAQASIKSQLASLGSNLLMVRPGASRVGGVALQSGAVTRLTVGDVSAIGEMSDDVKNVSGSVNGRVQVIYQNKNWNSQLDGVDVSYAQMRASEPVEGRFFTHDEVKKREKVVLLGTTVVRELFGEEYPIGKTVKINQVSFKVIGVLPPKGSNSFRDQDDNMLAPLSTVMYRLLGKDYVETIFVEAHSPDRMDELQKDILNLLARRQHIRNDSIEDAFQIRNMAEIRSTLEATTRTMSMLLGSIAAISLFVGGIGIMNIMLVSVTERTREIGLRKAIGATRKDIMMQFLVESVLLSLIGGAAGVLLGAGVSLLITLFAQWTVKISLSSVLMASIFSLVVGIVFGLGPAMKAAKLNPIDALRFE